MNAAVSCPGCGHRRAARLVHDLAPRRVVRCPACGLLWSHPLPTAEEAATLYDAAYFQGDKGYLDYAADEPVFRAEFRRRFALLRRRGLRGPVLDIGCAHGFALLEARRAGFTISGIEPDPEVARATRERLRCPVLAAPIEQVVFEQGRRPLITLFDVFEHLPEPGRVLRRLRHALKPGGTLAMTVPNAGGAWARSFGRHWPLWTTHEHLVHYSRRTLTDALLRAGYEGLRWLPARTPVSWATITHRLGAGQGPRVLRGRGVGLPAGTLFVLARRPLA